MNFHGLGAAKRPYEDGEEPYWISEEQFRAALDLVEDAAVPVVITFDDGNDSDYLLGVPELRKRGLEATFFVLAGKIGRSGYLTREMVAEIDADPLFAIGSHGMDHRAWPDLADTDLQNEIAGAQSTLSEICGRPVSEAGLPFGRYDRRVLAKLQETGHSTIYSSDGMPRLRQSNPIPRYSIRKDTSMGDLAKMIANQGSIMARAKSELRSTLKALR